MRTPGWSTSSIVVIGEPGGDEVRALDLAVGGGERDRLGPGRLGADVADVPRVGGGVVGQLAGRARSGRSSMPDAEAAGQLAGHVGRHAGRRPVGVAAGHEQEVAEVDRGAQHAMGARAATAAGDGSASEMRASLRRLIRRRVVAANGAAGTCSRRTTAGWADHDGHAAPRRSGRDPGDARAHAAEHQRGRARRHPRSPRHRAPSVRVAATMREAIDIAGDAEVILGFIPKTAVRRRAEAALGALHRLGHGHVPVPGDAGRHPSCSPARSGLVGGHLADTGFGLLLALTRQIATAIRLGPEGWDRREAMRMVEIELEGLTMGVVGFGGTGRAMAATRRGLRHGRDRVRRRRGRTRPTGFAEVWTMDRLDDLLHDERRRGHRRSR